MMRLRKFFKYIDYSKIFLWHKAYEKEKIIFFERDNLGTLSHAVSMYAKNYGPLFSHSAFYLLLWLYS